jgi:hypothetical protein
MVQLKESNKDWFPYSAIADKRRKIFELTETVEKEYRKFKDQDPSS